ncbi:MAG: hypothetical protein M1142_03685 [Patescibacteria group bacterium]|nr:hypothetical protein [Patescibacteria group bacterium]
MTSTQQFIPIEEIRDDLIFLKDGSTAVVITTSAVNFSLLFETEQVSIIESFAGLLNSLSFPIQIVVRSKKLDVSSYLDTLDKAAAGQTNLLLKNMTLRYRTFMESIIKENNVLDKQFYVCISASSLELGIMPKNISDKAKKAITLLMPRRDHILRQLSRMGLKARQVTTVELIELFYDIYNPEALEVSFGADSTKSQKIQPLPAPRPIPAPLQPKSGIPVQPTPAPLPVRIPVRTQPLMPIPPRLNTVPVPQNQMVNRQIPPSYPPAVARLTPPFVVEELSDDFGP